MMNGYDALRDIDGPKHPTLKEAVEHLIDLYTAWDKAEKAYEFRALLESPEKPVVENQPEESPSPISK